ncbi:RPA-related protein RADX [Lampris incognitus]|uniref:RPA-related protein RADX n=1 Tax=Lampris incognitus TaxID=2546036 RepID=UPI0024B504D9|nr:RPA-related protein RADX [Lampris incognitus]
MDYASSRSLTDVSQVSLLRTTLERLFSTKSHKLQIEEGLPAAVVTLQRHLSEQTTEHQQQQQQLDSYSYDLTITDGVWQTKCHLDHSLNHLIHRNILTTGVDISVTACSFVYNEKRLGYGYICLDKIKCGSKSSDILRAVNDVSSLPIITMHGIEDMALRSDVPLQVSRKHYLSLWNNVDPEGIVWIKHAPTSDVVLDVSTITLLCDLETSFKNKWKPFPLLVRILHKSRLRYYGKCGMKIEYPFQAYFEVADQSGTMSLVLWNELCPEWYQRLNVGTVLYLQNYTLKQSYSNRSRPQMDHHQMKNFDSIEICLNPRNPASVLTVISPKNVSSQWGLPEVAYQFLTRSELENLPNNVACDVIGLVTFVGRVQRVKSQRNKGPEMYWSYRWVHAVDGTSSHPFILEIFSSSQPEIFNNICPMTYLVCTQMRVCQEEGCSPYLTSSCETGLFITGYHKGQPYISDPKVKSFIQWTKTQKDSVVLQKSVVGGHYCYPHGPRIFAQPVADDSARIPLVAFDDLKKEIQSLQYREHKRLAIQGQIVAVQYLKCPKEAESEKEEAQAVSAGTSEEALPGSNNRTVESTDNATTRETPPSAVKTLQRKRRRSPEKKQVVEMMKNILYPKNIFSSLILTMETFSSFTYRKAGHDNRGVRQNKEVENVAESEEEQAEEGDVQQGDLNQDRIAELQVDSGCDRLVWESVDWPTQRQEVSEHLCQGGLYQESLSRKFVFDEKNHLLQWSNLHPSRWTPEQSTDDSPPAVCPGYYQITILGINKQMAIDAAFFPVASFGDPRAAGLPQEPHGNTMLSCLSSGFLCPLSDPASQSETVLPDPEEIFLTAEELGDTHIVCILDICPLGGEQIEILINKVYKATDFT